jgi:chromosome segregation protein
LEQRAKELDWSVSRGEESLRHHEARLADARQHIAGFETAFRHERATASGLEAELLKVGRQRAELGYRIRVIEADAARAEAEAATAEERLADEQRHSEAVTAALTELVTQLTELDREQTESQTRQFDLVRAAGANRAAADATLAQVERLQKEYTNKLHTSEQRTAHRAAIVSALDGLSQADADVQARLTAARGRIVALNADRDALADRTAREQTRLEGLRVRQGDLRGRIDVLEDLERSLEGLGAGVRQVLSRLGTEPQGEEPGTASAILGLVADLLTVPREVAPLVEIALGDTAQRFVVRAPDAVDAVAAAAGEVAGRVGFVPVQAGAVHAVGDGSAVTLAALVTCDHPDCTALPVQLLGRVLLADTLADARWLSALHPECRIIARTGELLEPDGTLTVGPLKAEAGLVSRKSELRDLRDQYRTTSELVARAEVELAELRRQADAAEGVLEAVRSEVALLSDEAGDLLQRIARQRSQVETLDAEIDLLRRESELLERQVQEGEAAWVSARMEAERAELASAEITARLAELKQALVDGEQERDRRQQAHTAAQVALSRATADRDRVRERVGQIDADLRKRKIEAVNLSSVDHGVRGRLADSTLSALRASAAQADAYREKEARERVIADLATRAASDRTAREEVRDRLHAIRHGWQEKQSAAHARELAVHDLSARRDAVAARIREDYAVDLAELTATLGTDGPEPSAGSASETTGDARPPNPFEAHQEIDDLKRKLARLGSVNMEALDELTRVEGEFNALQAQHDDLNAARNSLQQVIDAINADSRKLFTDTLTAVRGYFQELFRKLFGGGQADIVLEDESDVLESGIEITARPPGKELRSLSLLSGGEKTLTAVALLLAIFRNKPSPFCILDEVDAALDEANTQRLAGVLREFLDRSQFIVVTHKKRTMAAADLLWGVTMQESGVSRLLPMRFEDWPDEDEQNSAQAA